MSEPVQTTVIAAGTIIKGEVSCAGAVQIHGRVEGQVHGQASVEVGAEGNVAGEIMAPEVTIQGKVRANVIASKSCRLGPAARMVGELRAGVFTMEVGATFIGKAMLGPELGKPGPVPEAETPADAQAPAAAPQATIQVMPISPSVLAANRNARVIKAGAAEGA